MVTIQKYWRWSVVVALIIVASSMAGPIGNAQEDSLHPLQIHMQHWVRGSGKWRAPNPNYDPEYSGPPASKSVKDYGINWRWDAEQKSMHGEVTGVFADGSEVKFWAMYTFYNPVTERVIFQQTGRNGTYITGEDQVRTKPLKYGEIERQEAIEYSPDGQIKMTRHENIFHEDGSHGSNVYERDEDGEWTLVNQWVWRLTSTEEESD